MSIKAKRIRNIQKYFPILQNQNIFRVGYELSQDQKSLISKVGFTENPDDGSTVLPSKVGPVSIYNAEGKYVPDKTQPMETAYRQVEWTWEQWIGGGDTETHTAVKDVPYQRYPRKYYSPPSVELTVVKKKDGDYLLVSPTLNRLTDESDSIKHIANLFLEIFGECSFYNEIGDNLIKAPIKRLNWDILPRGKRPWKDLKKEMQRIISEAKKGNQNLIEKRLETVNNYGSDFVAIGSAGFRGYFIFGFEQKNLYIVESIFSGNATYVFDAAWESLTKLTKAEVLNNKLQIDRLIHRSGWDENIKKLMSKYKIVN